MFHESVPDAPLTVLVDYFGKEITDSLEVANHFPELVASGRLAFRLDTHGGRFSEVWTRRNPMPCWTVMFPMPPAVTGRTPN